MIPFLSHRTPTSTGELMYESWLLLQPTLIILEKEIFLNYQCDDHGVPCLSSDYHRFDDVCKSELVTPIFVDEIINESGYCRSIPLFLLDSKDPFELDKNDLLSGLNGKSGVYHLWISLDHCSDHDIYSFLCVYVGKGMAKKRILTHIQEKWPTAQTLYLTFFECENRIAKYIEQLFLDTYSFYLNKSECTGVGSLYARWDEFRAVHGTELERDAELSYDKDPSFRDWFRE
jgi:hypothetical protein